MLLARSAGFEPATSGFVVRDSIQLSYERVSGNLPIGGLPKDDMQYSTQLTCCQYIKCGFVQYFSDCDA